LSDDRQLIERIQRGDSECFRLLFEKYAQRLFNVVCHLVDDYDEANDITQEAFVKAYRSIGSFNFRSEFYTWLYRIGVNQAHDHLRRRKHRMGRLTTSDQADALASRGPDGSPDSNRLRLRLQHTIHQILAALNPIEREIITLREIEGLSYAEIAEMLQISLGTVKSRLARTRANVRQRFGPVKNLLKE